MSSRWPATRKTSTRHYHRSCASESPWRGAGLSRSGATPWTLRPAAAEFSRKLGVGCKWILFTFNSIIPIGESDAAKQQATKSCGDRPGLHGAAIALRALPRAVAEPGEADGPGRLRPAP